MNANGTSMSDSAHWWSFHSGGANLLYCDGTVRFTQYAADSVLPQMSTRNGGEAFSLP